MSRKGSREQENAAKSRLGKFKSGQDIQGKARQDCHNKEVQNSAIGQVLPPKVITLRARARDEATFTCKQLVYCWW
jgi:hypothetical protein